jgi:hypothetical protein
LISDLTNIKDFGKVYGSGPNDAGAGHGSKILQELGGPNFGSSNTVGGSDKLNVDDLLKNTTLNPPHHH